MEMKKSLPDSMLINGSYFFDKTPYYLIKLVANSKVAKRQSKQLVANIATVEKWLKDKGW